LVSYAKCHMANGPRPLPTAKADRLCLFMHIKMATINANKRTTITNINMEIHTHTHTHAVERTTKGGSQKCCKCKQNKNIQQRHNYTHRPTVCQCICELCVCVCICKTKTFDIIKWNVIVKKVTCILKQTKLPTASISLLFLLYFFYIFTILSVCVRVFLLANAAYKCKWPACETSSTAKSKQL